MRPVVEMYSENKSEPLIWSLEPPAHYREPPSGGLNLKRHRYHLDTLRKYLDSFTQLSDFTIMDRRYLSVVWQIRHPYPYSMDIYHLESRARIVSNFRPPGFCHAVSGNQLYVVQADTDENMEHNRPPRVSVYALKPTRN